MKKGNLTSLYILLLCTMPGLNLSVHAQFAGLFKKKVKVEKAPRAGAYVVDDEKIPLQNGFADVRENWVVYSSKNNNPTYKRAGGELQLKKLGLMDACYVIGTEGDFLELVKHKPDLIKDPKSRNIDPKSIEYLGWIHKNNLLLWNTSVKDAGTKFYVKALVAFKNRTVFTQLPNMTSGDSVWLYSGPSLKDSIGKCAPEDIVYVYKQSLDGREYLIGKAPQFNNDNAKDVVIGWISKDFIKLWGERLYFNQNTGKAFHTATADSGLMFLKDTGLIRKDTSFFAVNVVENGTMVPVENMFPVQKMEEKNDSLSVITTGALVDVLDRNDNYVLNVLGHKLYFSQYKKIISDQSKMNIVFVIDGGMENGKYIANVMAILQNLQYKFEASRKFRWFRFGAVVYKDNLDARCATLNNVMSLTSDYTELLKFLGEEQKEVSKCNDANLSQAVFSGLSNAAKLFKGAENESNIVVLIGGAGNDGSEAGWADIISRLSYVKAKMLVFQTHSISNPAYNDFVIQGKDILAKTAANISEFKKEKLVDFANVLQSESFSVVAGDSGIYYLDYPKHAMTQGYIMFPEKGTVMMPSFLERGLDSLTDKIYVDNKMIASSLSKYFATIGIRNTRIDKPFQCFYPEYGNDYLPVDFLKKYQFANRPYYLPASVNYCIAKPDSINNIGFGLLISESEYEQVVNSLLAIAGDDDYSLRDKNIIYAHLKQAYKQYVKSKKLPIKRRQIKRSTLARMLEIMTGYKTINVEWNRTTLRMIKKERYAKRMEGLNFIRSCYDKAKWLQENENNNDVKITNNNQTYYWLGASLLPG
ncbi:type VI secretion system protein TssR [Chitinophagaceae bacterium 26-R-25]|nr:type VI secretion system protein TssR [Chitinophagaceae bacterium 26-R-25]